MRGGSHQYALPYQWATFFRQTVTAAPTQQQKSNWAPTGSHATRMSTASSVSDSMIMQCQINHWVTNSLSFSYIDIKFSDICNLQWSGRRVCNVLQILTIIAESSFITCTKYWSCSCRWVIPIRTFLVTLWVTPGEPWGDSGSYHRPLLCIMNQSRTSAQLITDLSIVFNSAMFQNWSP